MKGVTMESFLQKHNFNVDRMKNNSRRFHIVRYYPKIQTYEFINVGIILYEQNEVFYRLLKPEEIAKLHCPSLIESKVLKNSLNSLHEYMQDQKQLNSVLEDVSKRYKNILDTSFQLRYNGDESSIELVNKLFNDYIGYKFESQDKETKLEKLIQKTEIIVKSEFEKFLKVEKSKIHGYNLDFFNEKTKTIHHSLLGSIENSENVARAFLNAPLSKGPNSRYDFLNTKVQISNTGVENKLKLSKLQLDIYNYSSEDDIAHYCENILN